MYRFPWSRTDNPGGWVEVTDICDISCKGCYRNQIEGHRPLDAIKEDILKCKELINCDYITLAGGEPLMYPYITDVIEFISNNNLKSAIFSNGVKLDTQLVFKLKKVGLSKIHFHIDSEQARPQWIGKNEIELNKLRQYYADLLWDIGGIQCGFHITVYRSNINYIPKIVSWARGNMHKVQHVSFIAYRSTPVSDHLTYFVNGRSIDPNELYNKTSDLNEINISTEEMYRLVVAQFPELKPCAYLNGSSVYDTNKFLVISNIGSPKKHYGNMGPKSLELAQTFYHIFNGRYFAFLNNPRIGKKVFILSMLDKNIRKAFKKFLIECLKNPARLIEGVYSQVIHFQQPNEIIDGKLNLCDDCVNMMIYDGKIINSCQLDEYRAYGTPITIIAN
ncbi:MAG: radical SAM protein [Cyclobacteriaceae bacterium]|nr:radical SAM protein [Cyclobacteriaceae bacterium]MCK5276946.1 radical SAM protein [Cyclobacteriaceae bacterium]